MEMVVEKVRDLLVALGETKQSHQRLRSRVKDVQEYFRLCGPAIDVEMSYGSIVFYDRRTGGELQVGRISPEDLQMAVDDVFAWMCKCAETNSEEVKQATDQFLDAAAARDAEIDKRIESEVRRAQVAIDEKSKSRVRRNIFANRESVSLRGKRFSELSADEKNKVREAFLKTKANGFFTFSSPEERRIVPEITTDELADLMSRSEPYVKDKPMDFVRQAMVKAASKFGSVDGKFNSAGFGVAFCELCGLRGALDGHIVKGILLSRKDVVMLSPGDAHWEMLPIEPESKPVDPEWIQPCSPKEADQYWDMIAGRWLDWQHLAGLVFGTTRPF